VNGFKQLQRLARPVSIKEPVAVQSPLTKQKMENMIKQEIAKAIGGHTFLMRTAASALVLTLGCSHIYAGVTTLDWTLTETGPGAVDGSGTLTVDTSPTDEVANGGYLVESIAGSYDGQTVTGLSSFVGADNLLLNITGTFDQLDSSGISFNYGTSGGQGNIYSEGGADQDYVSGASGTFSAVPEPVNMALAIFGVVLGGGVLVGFQTEIRRALPRALQVAKSGCSR